MTRHLVPAALLVIASFGAHAKAAADPQTPRIDQRQQNQAQRIDQGSASGALTPHEQHRLHRKQADIGRAEQHAKADGTVTHHERHRLHRMQQHASRDIHRQKHDTQTSTQ